MSIQDLERRLEEEIRERTRLQMLNGRLLQDLARLERVKVDTIAAMRQKAEQEIATLETKMAREIDDTRKDLNRAETMLRSNNIMVLNAERELENARKNENPNAATNRRRHA